MSNINTTYLKVDRFGVEQSRFLQLLDEANAYQWRVFEWNEKLWNSNTSQCLKIIQKVTFNIKSEASYVYILVDKSWLKMPKVVHFSEFLKTCSLPSNSVTRLLNRTKIDGKCQNWKVQMIHIEKYERSSSTLYLCIWGINDARTFRIALKVAK